MVRIKNLEKAKALKAELEELQDRALDCFSMDDEDLGKDLDIYERIYRTIQAIDEIIG